MIAIILQGKILNSHWSLHKLVSPISLSVSVFIFVKRSINCHHIWCILQSMELVKGEVAFVFTGRCIQGGPNSYI